MVYWLDNQENHKRAVNENWGRGCWNSSWAGSHTEKTCAKPRAFTGWGIAAKVRGTMDASVGVQYNEDTMRLRKSSWATRALQWVDM